MIKINYEKLKELCKKEGCYCPSKSRVLLAIANASPWLRLYFRNEDNLLISKLTPKERIMRKEFLQFMKIREKAVKE